MKVGLHSISYAGIFYRGKGLSLEEIIEKASSYGYEGVEVMGKAPVCSPFEFDEKRCGKVRELAQKKGIDLCFFAGYVDLNRPDPSDRERELLFAKESIRVARDLGCPYIRIYSGGDHIYPGATLWQQWDWTIEGLKKLLPLARDMGVGITLEVHTGVAQNVDSIEAMMKEVGWDEVTICLDPPLLALRDEPIEESVRRFGEKIVYSHVTDFTYQPPMVKYSDYRGLVLERFPRVHETHLGEGEAKTLEFMKACQEIGYKGYFGYEVCTPFHVNFKPPTMEDVDRLVEHAAKWLKQKIKEI
jgi:sugar phosphate isomerase/epimerase